MRLFTTLRSPLVHCLLAIFLAAVPLSAQQPLPTAPPFDACRALPADTSVMLRFAGMGALRDASKQAAWLQLWRDERMQNALQTLLTAWDRSLEDVDPEAELVWAHVKTALAAPWTIAMNGVRPLRWQGRELSVPDVLVCIEAGAEAEALLATLQTAAGFIASDAALLRDTERYRGHDLVVLRRTDEDAHFEIAMVAAQGIVIVALDRSVVRAALDSLADPSQPSLAARADFAAARAVPLNSAALELWCDLAATSAQLTDKSPALLPAPVQRALALLQSFGARYCTVQARLESGWGQTQISLLHHPELIAEAPAIGAAQGGTPDTSVLSGGVRWSSAALLRQAAALPSLAAPLAALRARFESVGLSLEDDVLQALGSEVLGYVELSRLASFPNAVLSVQGADALRLKALLQLVAETLAVPVEQRGTEAQPTLHFDMAHLLGRKPPSADGTTPKPATRGGLSKIDLASIVQPCFTQDGQRSVFALHSRGLQAALMRFDKLDAAAAPPALKTPTALPPSTEVPFQAWAELDLARSLMVAAERGGSGPVWMDLDGVKALLRDPSAAALLPRPRLDVAQHAAGATLHLRGLEVASILAMASHFMLEGDGIPLLALQHLQRHLDAANGDKGR